MARKSSEDQNKYDSVVLATLQRTEDKADNLVTDVAVIKTNLRANTRETRLLKDEVQETNGNVKDLQAHATTIRKEVVDIKKVVFPEKSVTPKDLPKFWKDPIVMKVTAIVGGAVILILLGLKDQIGGLL